MKVRARLTKRRLLLVLIGGAGVMALLGPDAAGPLRRTVHYALAPLGDAGMYLTTGFRSHFGATAGENLSPAELRHLTETNRMLRGRLVELERKLAEYWRQEKQKRRLYGQLRDFPCELIPARVVAADSLPYAQTRILNAGRTHGARPGAMVTTRELLTDRSKAIPPGRAAIVDTTLPMRLAAITSAALVGELTKETGAFTARLRLLTNPDFEIPAVIHRVIDVRRPRKITVLTAGAAASQTLGPANNAPIPVMARGDGRSEMVVHAAAVHNIKIGDWLMTSYTSGFLPAGIRVGEVVGVTDDSKHPGFVNLRIRPHADPASLREVYIVEPLGTSPAPGQR